MVTQATTQLVIMPTIIIGVIIGLIEIMFVHADENGMGWLIHSLHAIPVTIIFIFISMNIAFVAGIFHYKITENFIVDLIVRIIIGIIAMVKIGGAAAVVRGSKLGEKWYHILIIGVLVMFAPYLWVYILPYLPKKIFGMKIN